MPSLTWRRLIRTHPELFRHINEAPPIWPISERGIECDEGWFGLLEALCADLRARTRTGDPRLQFRQIKEKFSRLRIYHSRPVSCPQKALIRNAERLSAYICRRCGAKCPSLPGPVPAEALCALHGGAQPTPAEPPPSTIGDINKACASSPHPAHRALARWLKDAWPSFRLPPRLQSFDGQTMKLSFRRAPTGLSIQVYAEGGIDPVLKRKGRVVDLLLSLDGCPQMNSFESLADEQTFEPDFESLLLWINTRLACARWLGILELEGGSTAAGLFDEREELYADLGVGAEAVALDELAKHQTQRRHLNLLEPDDSIHP